MNLSTKFEGDDELRKGIEKTTRQIPTANYEGVVGSLSLIETRAKTHHLAGATLNAHTHYLQRSVKSDVQRLGTKVSGRVGSPAVYAAIHEFGGIIRPKNAKFLVFRIGDKTIHAKSVTIPKRPWLTNSAEDMLKRIEALFGRKIELAIG